jgi:hypothetical protein
VDPKLDVAKATVQAHPTMQDSFDAQENRSSHRCGSRTRWRARTRPWPRKRGGRGNGAGRGRRGGGANQPRIRLGKYENKEWHNLSSDEKTEVYGLRKEEAEKKRKAAAVETAGEEEPDKHAGHNFGKNAHKRNK